MTKGRNISRCNCESQMANTVAEELGFICEGQMESATSGRCLGNPKYIIHLSEAWLGRSGRGGT